MEPSETAVVSSMADGKCPYLAGRPPHGTYKLWPSSINVCYARPQDGKSYGHVSKETQERQCFGGEGVFCECGQYQRAQAAAVAAPEFGRAMRPGEDTSADSPIRRVRTRHRKKRHRHRELLPALRSLTFIVVLLATIGIVALNLIK